MVNLDELILKAHELSPLPASVVKLASLAVAPDTDLDEIANVIAYDQALTMRLLRAANSAASGSSRAVTQAREAMFRLGLARVLALCIASNVNSFMKHDCSAYGLGEGELWRHSIATATVAETLPEFARQEIPAETFTAALLHDVGKLVMGRYLSHEDLDFIQRARTDGGLDRLAAESQVLLVHHGELGGIVAQHWNLPDRIVKGIIYHHQPAAGLDATCDAVYLANLVSKAIESDSELTGVDEGCLERLELAPAELPRLVTAAKSRFEAVSGRYNAV